MSKFSKQENIDKRGGKILGFISDEKYIDIQPFAVNDKTEDVDGRLRLRDGKSKNLNKILEYQLKSSEKITNNKFKFSRKDIDYQLDSNIPTLMFIVDTTSEKVFWYYFPHHKDSLDLTVNYKYKTIDLSEFKIKKGSSKNLKDVWSRIAVSQAFVESNNTLNNIRDLINNKSPKAATSLLNELKDKVWHKSEDIIKFRILTNIAASKLLLQDEAEASKLFSEAYQYNPNDEKSLSNMALAHLLSGNKKEAKEYSLKTLEINPNNEQGLSVFIQSANKDERNQFIKSLPNSIKNSIGVIYALGFVSYKNGDHLSSEAYLKEAMKLDKGKSLEIISTLAGVLIEKNVPDLKKLELGGVTKKNNKDIEEAILLFTKAWGQVENTEMAKPKVKWLVNRSFGKRILGRLDEAVIDAKKAYELDPDNSECIKNLAILLWETGSFDEAYELLESFKDFTEFPQAQYFRALIKRDQKDYVTAISLIKERLEKSNLPNKVKVDGLALLIETYFMAGRPDEAEKYISMELKTNPKNILFTVFLSKLYDGKGDQDQAIEQAKNALSCLDFRSQYEDKIMVASQLYKLKLFKEAQNIYEEIADKETYSPLLHKLLYCYYETNNYKKALDLTHSITKKQGLLEDVLKIEGAIEEEQGDIKKGMATYRKLITINPDDTLTKIRIGYILFRQHKGKELKKYLESTAFDLKKLSLMDRYRLAHLFGVGNKAELFLETLYETRREFYDENQAHIEYIRLFFSRTSETDKLSEVKEVKDNTAVFLKYPGEKMEHYVIDDRDVVSKALKEIRLDDDLTKKLMGKKVGDKIEISPRLFAEIAEIKSKYVHALHESMSLHQSQFNNVSDLQSITLGIPRKKDGLPEGFDVIEDQITSQHEYSQRVESLYKNKQITIGAFASLIKRNLIEVWGGMVADQKIGINFSRGDLQERIDAIGDLKKSKMLVVDPIALLTIHSLKIGGLIVKNYGKLGISQSTIDLITEQMEHLEPIKNKGYLTIGKQGDKFTKWEVKPNTIKQNLKYLKGLILWIKENCNILPIEKSEDLDKNQKEKLEKVLGIPSIDTLLICRTSGRTLLSDDERLRTIGRNDYGIGSIWTQALLMNALARSYITEDEYSDLVVKLVGLNYFYTSVTGKNLFFALKKSGWKVEDPFVYSLRMLEPSFSDSNSSIKVCADFIFEVYIQKIFLGDVDNILFSLFNALTKGRPRIEMMAGLKKELERKFFLLPLDISKIDKTIENWMTGLVDTKQS